MRCHMKTNANLLTYFLTRTLFLGGGISTMFYFSKEDTYISAILGTLLGVIIIFIISKISNNINCPLKEYLKKNNFLNIILKIIYLIYLLFIILIILVILSTFLYSFFLIYTPSLFSCLPFVFLACFLNNKKIKNIYYLAFILITISIIIVITKTSLIASEFDYSNILPIFATSPKKIFASSFIYACLSTAPFLLIVDEEIEFKKSIKYYIIASITNIIVILSITLTLGDLVSVYSYPEYVILRKIEFFKFIENIENFISISWFFDLFIALSISSLKLKNILNTKKRIVPLFIVITILIIINKYISNNFYNSILIYKIFPYILLIFIIVICLLLLIKQRNKKKLKN